MDRFKNLLPLVIAIAMLAEMVADLVDRIKAKQGWKAAAALMSLPGVIVSIIDVTFTQVDDEFKVSREEGHSTIAKAFADELDLKDDRAEKIIEISVSLVSTLDASVTKLIDLAKEIRASKKAA